MPRARAKKPTPDPTEAVLAQVEKNPMARQLALAFHRKWQLWRLCGKAACHRGRGCRGEALGCAARHWKVVRSVLETIKKRGATGRAADRLAWHGVRLWSEVNGVLCKHEEYLFLGMAKGPFVHVVRENPDGTKTVLSHRDLTDEQARKLSRQCERPPLP